MHEKDFGGTKMVHYEITCCCLNIHFRIGGVFTFTMAELTTFNFLVSSDKEIITIITQLLNSLSANVFVAVKAVQITLSLSVIS